MSLRNSVPKLAESGPKLAETGLFRSLSRPVLVDPRYPCMRCGKPSDYIIGTHLDGSATWLCRACS